MNRLLPIGICLMACSLFLQEMDAIFAFAIGVFLVGCHFGAWFYEGRK